MLLLFHRGWSLVFHLFSLIPHWNFRLFIHRQPKHAMCRFALQRSFGRNILELLVYYLMPNKCKNLKDMKSSCLSICTSSLYVIYHTSVYQLYSNGMCPLLSRPNTSTGRWTDLGFSSEFEITLKLHAIRADLLNCEKAFILQQSARIHCTCILLLTSILII